MFKDIVMVGAVILSVVVSIFISFTISSNFTRKKKMCITSTPIRVWVNQPSTSQPPHHLHGQRFLAVHEKDDIFRIYFLSGSVISQQISKDALCYGWI
jgi:hypothetical protein